MEFDSDYKDVRLDFPYEEDDSIFNSESPPEPQSSLSDIEAKEEEEGYEYAPETINPTTLRQDNEATNEEIDDRMICFATTLINLRSERLEIARTIDYIFDFFAFTKEKLGLYY